MKLFCYRPQRIAVGHFIDELMTHTNPVITAVDESDMNRLRGVRDGLFLRVRNHQSPLPDSLWECLKVLGFCIADFDDSYHRARYEAERRK